MKSFRYRMLSAALAVLMGTVALPTRRVPKMRRQLRPCRSPRHGNGYGRHRMGFLAKQLNLTDDQKTQMKAIMQKEHPTMKPLFQQQRRSISSFASMSKALRSSQGPGPGHQKAQIQAQ